MGSVQRGAFMGLQDHDLLRSILQIWNLISTLGLKVLFRAGSPSMTSWALKDWDHVSRSDCHDGAGVWGGLPASFFLWFIPSQCRTWLGSRLPLSVPTTDSLSQILPTEWYEGSVRVACLPVQSEGPLRAYGCHQVGSSQGPRGFFTHQ